MIFLDANVFMYAAGSDSPFREPCRRIVIAAVRSGLEAATNAEVIQEILYRYRHASRPRMAMDRAREACAIVTALLPVDEDDLRLAMSLLDRHGQLGVRDAIHAASSLRWRCETIVSADRGFDMLASEGVARADPAAFARHLSP